MSTKIFHVHAVNLYDSLPIKGMRGIYGSQVVAASPLELRVRLDVQSYLFLYRFGTVAFFNVAPDRRDIELKRLAASLAPSLSEPTKETYDVRSGGGSDKVDLECVELHQMTADHLSLVAMCVSQSAALEYFENRAAAMLAESAKILDRLAVKGSAPVRARKLLQFIGTAASTRQNIVSNLAIVEQPEATWTSKDLQRLWRELQQNFDIETRLKSLDRRLSLVQDNNAILSDLAQGRKAVMLEMLIILLIAVEIAMGVLGR